MKINSDSGKGNFTIEKEGRPLTNLEYKSWFGRGATAELFDQKIEIKPLGVWNKKFEILKNGVKKGQIHMNWKGDISVTLKDEKHQTEIFLLKFKGTLKFRFLVINSHGEEVFTLKPSTGWKKLSYDYDVLNTNPSYDQSILIELLLYCGFSANLYMNMMNSGAAVGGGV